MTIETACKKLQAEWLNEDGFFHLLRRERTFDPAAFERVQTIFRQLEWSDDPVISKEFVRMTWFIPVFMEWQIAAMKRNNRDTKATERARHRMIETISDMYGLP